MSTHNPSNTPILPQCELADAMGAGSFVAKQGIESLCRWTIDPARRVRCFDENGTGIIWVKVDLSAPESRVDICDGINKWERK